MFGHVCLPKLLNLIKTHTSNIYVTYFILQIFKVLRMLIMISKIYIKLKTCILIGYHVRATVYGYFN